MPKAVSPLNKKKVELKTLPEGYVELRKLNYGEVLHRREIAQQMDLEQGEGGNPKGRFKMDMDGVAIFEFSRSVVDHNLTDENDQPLNFQDPQHVLKLDAPIAQEIEQAIDELNKFDADLSKDVPFDSNSEKPSEQKATQR